MGWLKKYSITGYKADSPDRNNPYNLIPSGRITMANVPHPVMGTDNYGNQQYMLPGGEYQFPGQTVFEVPMHMQGGGATQIHPEFSIVDYLASQGQDYSKGHRAALAQQYGIQGYDYSAGKNLELLSRLKAGTSVPQKEAAFFATPTSSQVNSVITPYVNNLPNEYTWSSVGNNVSSGNKSSNIISQPVHPSQLPTIINQLQNKGIIHPNVAKQVIQKVAAPSMPVPNVGNINTPINRPADTNKQPTFIPTGNDKFTTNPNPGLESGYVVDKEKNMGYIIKDHKVLSSFPVLTGAGSWLDKEATLTKAEFADVNHSLSASKKVTPSGTFHLVPDNTDLYGYKHFNLIDPVTGKETDIANHLTYAPSQRGAAYGKEDPRARDLSFGCINCRRPDIDQLWDSFPKGTDVHILPRDMNKTLADYMTLPNQKYGGWLQQYQGGGKLPVQYVNDPKDPRLQAYNDSLNRYEDYTKYKQSFKDLLDDKIDFKQQQSISDDYMNKYGISSSGINKMGNMTVTMSSPKTFNKPIQPYIVSQPKKGSIQWLHSHNGETPILDSTKTFQQGGKLPPIVVNDPNKEEKDYRNKLALYNLTQQELDIRGRDRTAFTTPSAIQMGTNNINDVIGLNRSSNVYPELVGIHHQMSALYNKTGIKPNGFTLVNGSSPNYGTPTWNKPIPLPPINKLPIYQSNELPTNIQPQQLQQVDPFSDANYSYQGQGVFVPSEYYRRMGYPNKEKMAMGGWLDSYQGGGIKYSNTPMQAIPASGDIKKTPLTQAQLEEQYKQQQLSALQQKQANTPSIGGQPNQRTVMQNVRRKMSDFAGKLPEPFGMVGSAATDFMSYPAQAGVNIATLKQNDWSNPDRGLSQLGLDIAALGLPFEKYMKEPPVYGKSNVAPHDPYSSIEPGYARWAPRSKGPVPLRPEMTPYLTDVTPLTKEQEILKSFGLDPHKTKAEEELVSLYRAQPVGQNPDMNMAAQLKAKIAAGEKVPYYANEMIRRSTSTYPSDANIYNREQTYGRWFDKNPNRLKHYLEPGTSNFEEGVPLEILKYDLPKSEAMKYNVVNFPGPNTLSLSSENEFILPKELIEKAKRYPASDWQKLIDQHKAWGLLPAGFTLGALKSAMSQRENKKYGGSITNNWLQKYK